jgi:hemerythrin-like domain-containing protein
MNTDRPRQICLPGQTHVAEGPHDQTGMYVMHHAFRRDLDRFQAAVRATPVDERDTWRALAARWERFAEALHHHHTVEDEHIWPVMERRIE